MNFRDCINQNQFILMEGALGERLKREYGLTFGEQELDRDEMLEVF